MRRGSALTLAGAAALLSVLGCNGERPDEVQRTPSAAASESGASEPAPVEAPPSPSPAGDPFAGITELRPQPWTGWPLENVDLATEAGWRIDAVSGEFELEDALSLTAEPGAFVLAIAPGEVAALRELDGDGGLELVIDHGDGIASRYAPVSEALVHAGLPVSRGAAIGLAAGPQLRLRVTVDDVPIDPLLVLRAPLHRWPALLSSPPAPAQSPQSPGQSTSG